MRANDLAENSHLPIRRWEPKQIKFKSQDSAQGFLSAYAATYNTFNIQEHLVTRPTLRTLRAAAHRARAEATVVV
ncbi:MAG: hypothetical protein JSR86_16250 [Proteobacteria bacterium]|nr:hypothetical protein [Pseudomonadota bacterium]